MLSLLDLFTGLSTLNCAYFFLLSIGMLWTAFSLLGGALASVDLPDLDLDLPGGVDVPHIDFHLDHAPSFDHGSVGVSPLSPIVVANFVTSFGGFGLIGTQLFRLPDVISLIPSAIGSSCIAVVMFLFYSRVLIAGQGSSEVRMTDISGATAEIIVPIPRNGLGQVAFVVRSSRMTRSARSADGKSIPRGAIVTIQSVAGNTVTVKRQ